ncbi:hypothetical protein [Mucilaginibacter gilvus]|uniref:Uncharacterized protein n=1 Tax=Mucilaginibacter gilvus TaxID=2305909 RepID=A0A3S3WD94_9SPHI|nr:hypothetical protein [Mucilaginibacter gilvus]RWY54235.1 hypothetical protein EPL05_09370 [Mucilaginibacter gilvus]
MKKIALLVFFVAGFGLQSYAQYIFDLKGKRLNDARKIEKGKQVDLASDYLSGPGIGQPLVFRRKEKLLPDLLVYYFPNTKDSTLNYILYEWDDTNFAKTGDAVKLPQEKLNPYIDKYLSLTKLATAHFGKPQTTGVVSNVATIATGRFKETDTFAKDGISVEMYIVLSNKQETNGIVSILPTHRIRMFVRTGTAEN